MLVCIVDTGELSELKLLDSVTGQDLVLNYFEQSGQLEEFFNFCPKQKKFLCSQETFDWCKELLEQFGKTDF
jgi:hypothetical protein